MKELPKKSKKQKVVKLAAMFGLDARIALAIFAALSVITGAALYSALDNVETIVFINEIKEIEKAWETYYLDTHKNLPRVGSDSTAHLYYMLATKNLVVNPSIKGWRGPYLSYDVQEANKSLLHPKYSGIYLLTLTDSASWGNSKDWNPYGRCSGKGCSIWLTISGIPYSENDMIKKMDKILDNSDGSTTGNFKWAYYVSSSKTYWEIFYKVGTM